MSQFSLLFFFPHKSWSSLSLFETVYGRKRYFLAFQQSQVLYVAKCQPHDSVVFSVFTGCRRERGCYCGFYIKVPLSAFWDSPVSWIKPGFTLSYVRVGRCTFLVCCLLAVPAHSWEAASLFDRWQGLQFWWSLGLHHCARFLGHSREKQPQASPVHVLCIWLGWQQCPLSIIPPGNSAASLSSDEAVIWINSV